MMILASRPPGFATAAGAIVQRIGRTSRGWNTIRRCSEHQAQPPSVGAPQRGQGGAASVTHWQEENRTGANGSMCASTGGGASVPACWRLASDVRSR